MSDGGQSQEQSAIERWWQEHSELDYLVAELVSAVESGEGAGEALDRLEEQLKAHFSVEEDVYFPLVRRLSPEHAPALDMACAAHVRMQEDLAQLRELLSDGKQVEAITLLSESLARFKLHEQAETRMLEARETA
jgi:hemerythrin superfamily protein